jgi:hypothetical protein
MQDVDANLVIGSPHGFHLKITTLTSENFPHLEMFPWFLCHMFLRGPTWELKGYLLGQKEFRYYINLWIFWKIFLGGFSNFLKISTDKPQYDTFFDYWIIEKVTAILIIPEKNF